MKRNTKRRLKHLLLSVAAMSIFLGASVALGQDEPANPYTKIIVEADEDELHELEQILYLECRGETWEGQLATVQTILNRVLDKRYPDTIHGVLSQVDGGWRQFSTWPYRETAKPGEAQSDLIEFICNCHAEDLPLRYTDYVYFSTKGRDGVERKKIDHQYFARRSEMDGKKLF